MSVLRVIKGISTIGWEIDLLVPYSTWHYSAVSVVSQFMHSHEDHLNVVYKILRYLKWTLRRELLFKKRCMRKK